MSSVVISETYLVIAAVIAASVLGGAVWASGLNLSDALRANSGFILERGRSSVDVIFAFGRSAVSTARVWVKNTGEKSYHPDEIKLADVFFGPRGNIARIPYGTAGAPRWSFTIANDDGDDVWERGETLEITVYWTTTLGNNDFYFRITTHTGATDEILFTAG